MEIVNHECYVSLEVAKLLKEEGFDYKVRLYYEHNGKLKGKNSGSFINFNSPTLWENNGNTDRQLYSAPTLDVAQRWLREVKNMSVEILFEKPGKWSCSVILDTNKGVSFENLWREEFDYDTYEEAQEAGIKKALELILEKGE